MPKKSPPYFEIQLLFSSSVACQPPIQNTHKQARQHCSKSHKCYSGSSDNANFLPGPIQIQLSAQANRNQNQISICVHHVKWFEYLSTKNAASYKFTWSRAHELWLRRSTRDRIRATSQNLGKTKRRFVTVIGIIKLYSNNNKNCINRKTKNTLKWTELSAGEWELREGGEKQSRRYETERKWVLKWRADRVTQSESESFRFLFHVCAHICLFCFSRVPQFRYLFFTFLFLFLL